jgi:hypothetical protein
MWRKTNPISISEVPDVNDIGVNDPSTVFKWPVSEVLTGRKATPISYV